MNTNPKYFENQDSFMQYATNKSSKYLIFVASSTIIELENFNKNSIHIHGAIFSHVIFKNETYDKGLISIEIDNNSSLEFIENVKKYKFNIEKFDEAKSIITVFNGFSKYNQDFFMKLFENIPINTNILGGGAGIIEDKSKKVFFNNKGFFLDSAILLSLNKKMKIASRHGWKSLSGPYVVTSSEKNILKTIDYIDAFEIYKNEIKKDCNIEITKENFLEISKNYPIGLVRYVGVDIVRDPISFDNGKLVLVTEVKVNSIINFLKGNKTNLINAAKKAANEALDKDCDLAIIFNCITRKTFLEQDFKEELNVIFEEITSSKMIGAVTIGEIANNGNRYITLLNKSCVIGGI